MADPKCVEGKFGGRSCEIPGGTFQMGSTDGDPDEKPVRSVTMTGFKLDQTEVSVGQYRAFLEQDAGTQLKAVLSGCGTSGGTLQTVAANKGETKDQLRKRAAQVVVSNSCDALQIVTETPKSIPDFEANKKGDQYPVVGLTMDEKRAYCRATGGDLATAAQLHFASRYDEQDSIKGGRDQRIIWDNGFRSTELVTAGYQNRFGIYNLLGGVWESALDAYDGNFYARMASTNPYNPMTFPLTPENRNGQLQEFSGGSFGGERDLTRAANRGDGGPGSRLSLVGFRCVR